MSGIRGVYRGIYSALPDDPDYQQLSWQARLVLLTARLCRDAGPAAIFRFYPEVLAAQTGLPVRTVSAALTELQQARWVEVEGPVLWIRNGLRYDPTMRLSNPRHRLPVTSFIASLPRLQIVARFCQYYDLPYPTDRLSHSLSNSPRGAYVDREPLCCSEQEQEQEQEQEKKLTTLSGSSPDTDQPETVNGPQPRSYRAEAREVLRFLNEKAGRAFRDTDATIRLIEARLRSGATVANCRGVIARKVRAWNTDPKMRPYLRPETLFNATKFESYLGEREP